jgi:hypothetical protein
MAGVFDSITSRIGGTGGGLIKTGGQLLVLIVIIAIIGGIIYYFIRRKQYNTTSPIFSERSGAMRFFIDKGFYSKDKTTNLWDFQFQKLNETVMPPADNIMGVGSKGQNVAYFYQNSGGEIYPCELRIVPKEEGNYREVTLPDGRTINIKQDGITLQIHVIEPDIQLWNAQQEEKLFAKAGKLTWWGEYGYQICFYGTVVLVLALLYLVSSKLDGIKETAQLMNQAMHPVAQVINSTG